MAMGVYFNGRMSLSKRDDLGSIPSAPAKKRGSIPSAPADWLITTG